MAVEDRDDEELLEQAGYDGKYEKMSEAKDSLEEKYEEMESQSADLSDEIDDLAKQLRSQKDPKIKNLARV